MKPLYFGSCTRTVALAAAAASARDPIDRGMQRARLALVGALLTSACAYYAWTQWAADNGSPSSSSLLVPGLALVSRLRRNRPPPRRHPGDTGLIPRAALFGNPEYAAPSISPDGKYSNIHFIDHRVYPRVQLIHSDASFIPTCHSSCQHSLHTPSSRRSSQRNARSRPGNTTVFAPLADRSRPRLSPYCTRDTTGLLLAYLRPSRGGVLNVWCQLVDAPDGSARMITSDTRRGIRTFGWAEDSKTLLYLQARSLRRPSRAVVGLL